MRLSPRTNLVTFGAACLTLAACGVANPQAGQVIVVPPTTRYAPHRSAETGAVGPHLLRPEVTVADAGETSRSAPVGSADPPLAISVADAALRRANDIELMNAAAMIAAQHAEMAATGAPASVAVPQGPPRVAALPAAVSANSMNVAAVEACIRDHESGNYTESANPGGATGAYQYERPTFETWQARWATGTGYTGLLYAAAYEAPPAMQDAITAYALTHGGAGNWSMKWGNDPCTAGLPGGG